MAEFNVYRELLDLSSVKELCMTRGVMREYAKGDVFLSAGSVAGELGYVESGYMRFLVNTTDGEERVVGFSFDDDYVCDINSNLSGFPSEVSIVAGRRSRVWVVSMEEFVSFAVRRGLRFCVGIEVVLFRTIYGRYLDMYRLSPRERYMKVLKAYPSLFQKAPLCDIASWLCITPVHLSRLRKQLAE
ncbi:Crp/Fnr family transcriptional regulator [Muribaculaceae bacterium Isolate-110 (HZI)]|nr:Crp/Fnr family transcriptional regulator [Muribaculaceae bacterium Isolate-110 (HZI)]